jgi:hypothetical protein
MGERAAMRDAVLHLVNDQPLLVDLVEAPKAADQGLLCTNVRTSGGLRPSFIDRSDSTFFFPYLQIRFLEIHPIADAIAEAGLAAAASAPAPDDADELDLDEDLLRRVREA